MSWWAVAAAVASSVVQGANQAKTARKQDRIAAEGIRKQAEIQRQANARSNQELDVLERSTPEDEYQSRSAQIRDQLRKKQSMALAGIQNTGGGDAVTSMAMAARPEAVGYGDNINEWLSRMDSASLQRQGEGFGRADTENALNTLRRESSQQDYLTRLRASGVRDNPWLTMLSQGLGAFGMSGGMSGFGGGAGKAVSNLGGATPQQFYSAANNALPNMPAQQSGKLFSIFGP